MGHFMVRVLYGRQDFQEMFEIKYFMVRITLWRNCMQLYGELTLWRDGFSQNRQNRQLYGAEHFMVERGSALWGRDTNFMDFILKGGV